MNRLRTCFLLGSILLIFVVNASPAQLQPPAIWLPGGFNLDSQVTFTPTASSYRTLADTAGCPAGFAGKFAFTAVLTNKAASPPMAGLAVRVLALSNGNLLLDPQTNALLGEGDVMKLPKVGQYADGVLSPNETMEARFVVCLKTRQPFQFLIDVIGSVTLLVSVNRTGTDSGNFDSDAEVKISADGRIVAFVSQASDLVTNDTNGRSDVFVRDLKTGATTLVSVNRAGTDGGNSASGVEYFDISATGRFVVFRSSATDLVATPTNGWGDVFVRDLQAGTTTLVSINLAGTRGGNGVGNDGSSHPSISADGRFVAFDSGATDLVATPTASGTHNVFVRDLQTGTTTLVSVNRAGTQGSGGGGPTITPNGRFVLFESAANDLVTTPIIGGQLFVRDLHTGTTTLVSINRTGTGAGGNQYSRGGAISADGRFVVFVSGASDLVATDTNGRVDVFMRDLQMGTTSLVTVNRTGTDSANAFISSGNFDTFGLISANGRFVVFKSFAMDLVAMPVSGHGDTFIRDMQLGITTLVSVNQAGTGSGNGGTSSPLDITPDGRFVAFAGNSSDFVPNANGFVEDAFLRDLQTGVTTLIGINWMQTGSGNGNTLRARFSADGHFVAFTSAASDLVANDANKQIDVFVRPIP